MQSGIIGIQFSILFVHKLITGAFAGIQSLSCKAENTAFDRSHIRVYVYVCVCVGVCEHTSSHCIGQSGSLKCRAPASAFSCPSSITPLPPPPPPPSDMSGPAHKDIHTHTQTREVCICVSMC